MTESRSFSIVSYRSSIALSISEVGISNPTENSHPSSLTLPLPSFLSLIPNLPIGKVQPTLLYFVFQQVLRGNLLHNIPNLARPHKSPFTFNMLSNLTFCATFTDIVSTHILLRMIFAMFFFSLSFLFALDICNVFQFQFFAHLLLVMMFGYVTGCVTAMYLDFKWFTLLYKAGPKGVSQNLYHQIFLSNFSCLKASFVHSPTSSASSQT